MATDCIHVPDEETKELRSANRKLRWRNGAKDVEAMQGR